MTETTARRSYDTRSPADILAGPRFAPYRDLQGVADIPVRELRMLDRFLAWAEARSLETPCIDDLLALAEEIGSARALADLRLAFGKFLPADAQIRAVVQEAIRMQKPRSRRCDRRSREEILSGAHFAPYRDLPGMSDVALEDLRVLDRFLVFAVQNGVEIPTPRDFLAFSADTTSSRRLRALEAALARLLPGNPAVVLTLREAIQLKTPEKERRKPAKPRPADLSLPLSDLPLGWQRTLAALRAGGALDGHEALAKSVVTSMEETLRAYARTMTDNGLPIALSLTGIRLHEDRLRARGRRPATLHTATMRLRQFGHRIGEEAYILEALKTHEKTLRRAKRGVVPLKEARLAAIPDLQETWSLALGLLEASHGPGDRASLFRLRNEAAVLALWTLLPLRLEDGTLRWGEHVVFEDGQYWIDITTNKEGVPLRGRLHPRLTRFLDALVLQGVDPAYLPEMRERAQERRAPLFRKSDGAALSKGYPSTVWRKHLGTGAHIARTRIHTELGKLGPAGVDAALALCAQIDPESRLFYQGKAVAAAQMARGQELVEGLFAEFEGEF
ncbi:hypothetical protein NHN26_14245 [Rhodovulum tesquicola]|uniref:hypothetical protein n=1 Tax=Rhodovulum tesquicola TaxID=540254 RepID=UPI0020981B99|nr:hypothetical protein [Rhodovulum tesquicola]MCO8146385.1 hypothetical protein [Rhodovulum tesquicola]